MSRIIGATPERIYAAYLDPVALAAWLPPKGMTARVETFEAWPGGGYRMVLTYIEAGAGKTTEQSDVVHGRFLELVPHERIVQTVMFDSDDPAFAGEMRMTWLLEPEGSGTRVTIRAEDVPTAISVEDHEEGFRSTLANLAEYVEGINR